MSPVLFHNTIYSLVESYGQSLQVLQAENEQLKARLTQLRGQLTEALKKKELVNDS